MFRSSPASQAAASVLPILPFGMLFPQELQELEQIQRDREQRSATSRCHAPLESLPFT